MVQYTTLVHSSCLPVRYHTFYLVCNLIPSYIRYGMYTKYVCGATEGAFQRKKINCWAGETPPPPQNRYVIGIVTKINFKSH
jgi:hypothetical protein